MFETIKELVLDFIVWGFIFQAALMVLSLLAAGIFLLIDKVKGK